MKIMRISFDEDQTKAFYSRHDSNGGGGGGGVNRLN
jgi:hypothetical protein